MRRPLAVLALLAAIAPLGGCASFTPDPEEFFRQKVEISSDDLDGPALPGTVTGRLPIDVLVAGYDEASAPLLDAIVRGLEKHPGLAVARLSYEGATAARGPALRPVPTEAALTSGTRLRLACHAEYSAQAGNGLIAFPGMIPFLPIWLGYGFEMKLSVDWTLSFEDAPEITGRRRVEVAFREKNAHRSAAFHLWPSTGFFGVQFVMGLVLAPTFWSYDPETTPLLVKALEPRLGPTIARGVWRDAHRAVRDPLSR